EAFAQVLVTLPDLVNEGSAVRMLAQHAADLVEIDLAFADLQAFAGEALGVAEMDGGRVRTELRQACREVETKMIGGEPSVGNVEAHAQAMSGTERSRLFRKDEDVLMPLAAEMPGEGRHGLRNQLDAVEVELLQARGEEPVTLGLHVRRQRLVHGEAANIGDDRRPLCLWEEFLQAARDVDDGLGLLQRV